MSNTERLFIILFILCTKINKGLIEIRICSKFEAHNKENKDASGMNFVKQIK